MELKETGCRIWCSRNGFSERRDAAACIFCFVYFYAIVCVCVCVCTRAYYYYIRIRGTRLSWWQNGHATAYGTWLERSQDFDRNFFSKVLDDTLSSILHTNAYIMIRSRRYGFVEYLLETAQVCRATNRTSMHIIIITIHCWRFFFLHVILYIVVRLTVVLILLWLEQELWWCIRIFLLVNVFICRVSSQ